MRALAIWLLLTAFAFADQYNLDLAIAIAEAEHSTSQPYDAGDEAEQEECSSDIVPREIPVDRIRWQQYTAKNVKLAQRAGKPILVHIDEDNCRFCIKMDREVFTNKQVILQVNRDFTPMRINASRSPQLAKQWKVKGYPSDVLVSAGKHQVLSRKLGYAPSEKYLKRLKQFKQVHQKQQKKTTGYPIRNRWWTGCSSWEHMADAPAHYGKYDSAWLKSLTWAELQSLHSDDHEGRVKRTFVVQPT